MDLCGSPSQYPQTWRCALIRNSQALNMSAAGHSLLTSPTCAPHVFRPAQHDIIRMATPRHIVTVRESVARKVPSSSDYRCTDVSASLPSPYQATSMQQEALFSFDTDTSVQHLRQSLPVPQAMAMADMTHAFLAGAAAVAASGQLQRFGYDWAEAVLVMMAWQQALAAQQKPAAEEALLAKYCKPAAASSVSTRDAVEGLEKAKWHLRSKADSFSWQLLDALNANGYERGLAFEQLPTQLQLFAYRLLLKCGCIGTWGQPIYRKLPAIAANIRPGIIVTTSLQQYLSIAQYTPRICRDEMDGTWWGDAEIRIHPFQVVSAQELAKALGPDMLLELFESGSHFAADLALVAAKLGLIDGATAAACISSSSSSRSLAEILLLRMNKAFMGITAAAIVSMRRSQQQASSIPSISTVAVTDDPDGSSGCLTCTCGGAGGSRRGSITAVGSDGYDEHEAGAGLVAICKGGQDMETATIAARANDGGSRRGLLHEARSLFRCLFQH